MNSKATTSDTAAKEAAKDEDLNPTGVHNANGPVVREVVGLPNQAQLTAAIRAQVTQELEEKYRGWTPPEKAGSNKGE